MNDGFQQYSQAGNNQNYQECNIQPNLFPSVQNHLKHKQHKNSRRKKRQQNYLEYLEQQYGHQDESTSNVDEYYDIHQKFEKKLRISDQLQQSSENKIIKQDKIQNVKMENFKNQQYKQTKQKVQNKGEEQLQLSGHNNQNLFNSETDPENIKKLILSTYTPQNQQLKSSYENYYQRLQQQKQQQQRIKEQQEKQKQAQKEYDQQMVYLSHKREKKELEEAYYRRLQRQENQMQLE
ncbi:hypothetical protein PPERSA_09451 [Pseudocohnilembus persalinus]|uniref:Uncharacterized protein n=1 Tax=Pseudocohnilembus persalinus TaxID=266149 RepID=A0A0V0Q9M8_PSEPJ|nr:hypothetical protein PPERSA_09451 [Pseudocohnilembus persalinus]|eukprot:KRW98926.1 hypothetical protein PPERSA_09451 [Pseudocohnilembus persalinus]